jgi:hypothetical protein
MSLRHSLAVVVIGSLFVSGCAQDSAPTSPSSPRAGLVAGGPLRAETGVFAVVAQLIVVKNQLASANQQLKLFLHPPDPIAPPDPVIPPDPIFPPWGWNAIDFYVKANGVLASIPPNPVAPLTDALNGIVAQADLTLSLIGTAEYPPDPIIPDIVTQAHRTKTLVAALQSCGDVCPLP